MRGRYDQAIFCTNLPHNPVLQLYHSLSSFEVKTSEKFVGEDHKLKDSEFLGLLNHRSAYDALVHVCDEVFLEF